MALFNQILAKLISLKMNDQISEASAINNDSERQLSRQGSTTSNISTIGLNALKKIRTLIASIGSPPNDSFINIEKNNNESICHAPTGNEISYEEDSDVTEHFTDPFTLLDLPTGSTDSEILNDFMIYEIMGILPPRATCYPWVMVYSSEKNGFSLSTLYRKMEEWDRESPVLLLIQDAKNHVFGALASTKLHPCDSFYGTGDSSILFRFTHKKLVAYKWTGINDYFINSSKEHISFGACDGKFGLWLDEELFRGRSEKCVTFDNEPLAADSEDFSVKNIEVFGFSE